MQGERMDSTPSEGGEGAEQAAPPAQASAVAFTPLYAPRRHQDVVRRHAVLVPLMGPGGDDPKILDQVGRLIAQRRARLYALADAGLPEISGGEGQGRRLRFALNCKPSFVVTKEQTACCNLAFCPFCWARWVYEVWVNIEHAFFADAPPGATSPQDLIYRSATQRVPCHSPPTTAAGWPTAWRPTPSAGPRSGTGGARSSDSGAPAWSEGLRCCTSTPATTAAGRSTSARF